MKLRKSPPYILATLLFFSHLNAYGNKQLKSRPNQHHDYHKIFHNATSKPLLLQITNRKNQKILSQSIQPHSKLSIRFKRNFSKVFIDGKIYTTQTEKNLYTFT